MAPCAHPGKHLSTFYSAVGQLHFKFFKLKRPRYCPRYHQLTIALGPLVTPLRLARPSPPSPIGLASGHSVAVRFHVPQPASEAARCSGWQGTSGVRRLSEDSGRPRTPGLTVALPVAGCGPAGYIRPRIASKRRLSHPRGDPGPPPSSVHSGGQATGNLIVLISLLVTQID